MLNVGLPARLCFSPALIKTTLFHLGWAGSAPE